MRRSLTVPLSRTRCTTYRLFRSKSRSAGSASQKRLSEKSFLLIDTRIMPISPKSRRNLRVHLLRTKLRHEVHLERVRELRRRAEGEVYVLPQHLGDVRPRNLHAPRQLRLRNAQLLHPPQDAPQKRRANPVDRLHINAPRAAPCRHQTVHYSLLPIPCAANAPRPWGMQPNTSPYLNRIYLTSPLLELPPNILTFRLTDCKHEKRHVLMKKSDTFHPHFIHTSRHILQYVSTKQVCFISSFLLEDLADEREDEERKPCAPHERIDHHDNPPEYSARRGAKRIGHNVPRLPEEALEEDE